MRTKIFKENNCWIIRPIIQTALFWNEIYGYFRQKIKETLNYTATRTYFAALTRGSLLLSTRTSTDTDLYFVRDSQGLDELIYHRFVTKKWAFLAIIWELHSRLHWEFVNISIRNQLLEIPLNWKDYMHSSPSQTSRNLKIFRNVLYDEYSNLERTAPCPPTREHVDPSKLNTEKELGLQKFENVLFSYNWFERILPIRE